MFTLRGQAPTVSSTLVQEMDFGQSQSARQDGKGLNSLDTNRNPAFLTIGEVRVYFRYKVNFGTKPSTGYERLLHDCVLGYATLFQGSDIVEAGWNVVAPILDVGEALPPGKFPNYAAGSWGPKEADDLMERDKRHGSMNE